MTRRLVETGRPGSVINVTSIEGVRAAPGYAAYAAAKAGVINYTKTAAFELAPHNIRVNALAPDLTVTEGLLAMSPDGLSPNASVMIPMGRPGHVDEMACAAVFLASEMSSYISGQTIHVDGGTDAAGGWYYHQQTGEPTLAPGVSEPSLRRPARRRCGRCVRTGGGPNPAPPGAARCRADWPGSRRR